MIVLFEKLLCVWGVLLGGFFGNVGSLFYMEGVEEWVKGEYFELYFYKVLEQVDGLLYLEFGSVFKQGREGGEIVSRVWGFLLLL